jgi:hypothetical protein
LIFYWAGWNELRIALPVLLAAALVYAWQQGRERIGWIDARAGLWLVGYLCALLVMSLLGSFGDGALNIIPAPWDTLIVAVIGIVGFYAGVHAAGRYLADHPVPEPYVDEFEPYAAETAGHPIGAPLPGDIAGMPEDRSR